MVFLLRVSLGKHSGRHAFKVKLNELGFSFEEDNINKLFKKFKALADKKKQIFEEDLYSLVDNEQNFMKKLNVEL